jgi:hypothetical protein
MTRFTQKAIDDYLKQKGEEKLEKSKQQKLAI